MNTRTTTKQQRRSLTLGEYLVQMRTEAGISRRELGRLSGVGRMTIARFETNWFKDPPPDDLMRLGRALELNQTDLFLLAGLPVPAQSASLDVMLRRGYGVADDDVPELKREIETLIAQHNAKSPERRNPHEPST